MLAIAIFYKWLAIDDAQVIYNLDMHIEFCVPNGHCCQCDEDPYNIRWNLLPPNFQDCCPCAHQPVHECLHICCLTKQQVPSMQLGLAYGCFCLTHLGLCTVGWGNTHTKAGPDPCTYNENPPSKNKQTLDFNMSIVEPPETNPLQRNFPRTSSLSASSLRWSWLLKNTTQSCHSELHSLSPIILKRVDLPSIWTMLFRIVVASKMFDTMQWEGWINLHLSNVKPMEDASQFFIDVSTLAARRNWSWAGNVQSQMAPPLPRDANPCFAV